MRRGNQLHPRLSSEEFLSRGSLRAEFFEEDFLDYLRGLSFKERRAFDMAMGYVFGKGVRSQHRAAKAGLYVLLKASDALLGPFYNEHRDRSGLVSERDCGRAAVFGSNGELLLTMAGTN